VYTAGFSRNSDAVPADGPSHFFSLFKVLRIGILSGFVDASPLDVGRLFSFIIIIIDYNRGHGTI